jgi:hypothetical protein
MVDGKVVALRAVQNGMVSGVKYRIMNGKKAHVTRGKIVC